jgi:ankyrin repeat protein
VKEPIIIEAIFYFDDDIELVDNIKGLIKEGADVNAVDDTGWTALMWATYYDYIETARLLIDKGANIDVQNNYGETALVWAEYRCCSEIAKLLKKDTLM